MEELDSGDRCRGVGVVGVVGVLDPPSAGRLSEAAAAAEPRQAGAGRGRDADDKVHCLKRVR